MQPSINQTKIYRVFSFLAAGCTTNLQGGNWQAISLQHRLLMVSSLSLLMVSSMYLYIKTVHAKCGNPTKTLFRDCQSISPFLRDEPHAKTASRSVHFWGMSHMQRLPVDQSISEGWATCGVWFLPIWSHLSSETHFVKIKPLEEEPKLANPGDRSPSSTIGAMKKISQSYPISWNNNLVGGLNHPEKNYSMGRIIPYIVGNKQCLKPPTRNNNWLINFQWFIER